MNANNMLGDQNRSFAFADAPVAGQPMNNQIIPHGMMSPTGHQPMKAGFAPQQTTSQFHHSPHPRTPLACYGKLPDMSMNVGAPGPRYLENSPQSKNYFYGNPTGLQPYNSPGQMNSMCYNEGSFYPRHVYPQVPQQHYYKQHQMSPMLPQNAAFYQEVPQQNMGYSQRMVPEQISPPGWNSPYKIQPQMLDGSGFGDCNVPKVMPKHAMERFHSPAHCFVQQGHPSMMEFKKERYVSPPHGVMTPGFDPRMYNNYEGPVEKYKANNMKFPEELPFGQQNAAFCGGHQPGNYLPGRRLEHFSQANQHFQGSGYGMGSGYPLDVKIPPSELDKIKHQNHNPAPYCHSVDAGYYNANPMEQMNHFKAPQRRVLCQNVHAQPGDGMVKNALEGDLEAYHSPSTETCSGSSSPSYFEVDVKYSLPSTGFPSFGSPAIVPQRTNPVEPSPIKTEPLSSINFLISQNQSTVTSRNFQHLPSANNSLEKQNPSFSSCVAAGTIPSRSGTPVNARSSSLATSLLLQSSKCITSTVKMTPTPSKINSILDMGAAQKGQPGLSRRFGLNDGLSKVAVARKNRRRKAFGEVERAGPAKMPSTRYVTVPYKWRRIIENESVYYISPSRVRLESLKEICQYLLTDGTCKCGLLCPLQVEQVFVFDWTVKSRYMTVEEIYNSSNNVASLCYHKRKYKQSVSAAINAAAGGNCRPGQQPTESLDRGRKAVDNVHPRSGEPSSKFKGAQPLQSKFNPPSVPGFPCSEANKMIRSRAYTKVRERRRSKLETSLCDSLKNLEQQNPAAAQLSVAKQNNVPPNSAFTVFQGQLKDSIQAKTSALDSYDSDATKSASDIYCSSGSSEDEEDDGFGARPRQVGFKTNLIKLPGCTDGGTISARLTCTSTSSALLDANGSRLSSFVDNPSVPLSCHSSDSPRRMSGDPTKTLIQRKSFQVHGSGGSVERSPIKLVEDMVSGLLTTKNSLAEVTALMMSKVEFEKRRKILPEVGNQFLAVSEARTSGERTAAGCGLASSDSSGFRIDEAIHQSVTNHLKHLDIFKSSVSNASLIKPASMSLMHQNVLPSFSMGANSFTTNSPTLLDTVRSQSIFSSPLSSGSKPNSTSLNSIISGHLVSTPGFFYKSSLEAADGLVPKSCSAGIVASTRTTSEAPGSSAVGGEDMFSEEEEDSSSCVVIENWLEEGCLDKSGGSSDGAASANVPGAIAISKESSGGTIAASAVDEDLMKTTGTQTSTPASNVSNSTLELVDGDSRETICCAGVDNAVSLDDVTFASVVSSSSSSSLAPLPVPSGKTPPLIVSNPAIADAPSIIAGQSITGAVSRCVSAGEDSINAGANSVLTTQQVPQAQVVMVPTQQPFLIPHHQTFDAQLYQTSPAGYLQSLGFGFAQGQVGLLHFGQVVNPASSASSQSLGLALGLGVNLSGGVVNTASREQTTQPLLESVQQSSSTLAGNATSSSVNVQTSMQDSTNPSVESSGLTSVLANQDQSQASSSSVAANQLFQLVVSQGVQPAHHFLVPNYSSFAPFAGAALVPVPMVQQNSMAFCNLVAASGAPTLFTVGQSPFGFVAAAGPAMQMLAGVNVGEKRQESTSIASHDAPDSTVDSEDAMVIPCNGTSSNGDATESRNSASASIVLDVPSARVISSSRSSTESMTCQTSIASVPPSVNGRFEEYPKANELSSSSETDDEIGFEMTSQGCSKISLDTSLDKSSAGVDDDNAEEEGVNNHEQTKHGHKNDDLSEKAKDENSREKRKKVRKKFDNNLSKSSHFMGVTKLLKQTKNKKLKAFLNKSRLAGKSSAHLLRSAGKSSPKVPDRSFSPALSGTSENTSEVVAGESMTPCSSSGDCMVTTTDSTARESAYRAEGSRASPLTSTKGILRKKAGKAKEESKISCRPQKPDSPVSSDDTIDDVDSTTTTTAPVGCQVLRSFNVGDLVWGPARGFPSWPGKLVSENEVRGNPKPESGKIWVKWFGDNTYAQAELDQLKTLSEGLETHHNARKSHRRGRKMNAGLEAAIQEAMSELDRQMADQHQRSGGGNNCGGGGGSVGCAGERPIKKSRRC